MKRDGTSYAIYFGIIHQLIDWQVVDTLNSIRPDVVCCILVPTAVLPPIRQDKFVRAIEVHVVELEWRAVSQWVCGIGWVGGVILLRRVGVVE